jgi:nucleotide-binding universal stress UspA family protein
MFKNILIAYDGSEHARKAAKIVRDLAQQQNQEVVFRIVTVMDPSPWEMGEPYLSEYIGQRTAQGQKLIQEATALLSEGSDIHSELLFGSPAESILQVAETRGCDLIVMGTRGLGLLQGLLLGSQTQKVISHAHCPVLVVK